VSSHECLLIRVQVRFDVDCDGKRSPLKKVIKINAVVSAAPNIKI
jgi:hypothetical protein